MQQGVREQQPKPVPVGQAHGSRVTVRAERQGGGWQFTMRQDGAEIERLDFSKDALKMKKRDWHEIDFMLDDPSGTLAFHPDKWEAIWVARGTETQAPACPDRRCRDEGVYPQWVKDRQLRLRNHNAERCLLSFRLNFVQAGEQEIVAWLDPVIRNGNGGDAD